MLDVKKKISIDNKDYVNQSKGNLVWEKFKMWTDKHLTLFIWKTRKSSLEYKICTAFKRETNVNENELAISYMTYDMTYSRPPPNLRFYHHAKFVGQPKNTVFQWKFHGISCSNCRFIFFFKTQKWKDSNKHRKKLT